MNTLTTPALKKAITKDLKNISYDRKFIQFLQNTFGVQSLAEIEDQETIDQRIEMQSKRSKNKYPEQEQFYHIKKLLNDTLGIDNPPISINQLEEFNLESPDLIKEVLTLLCSNTQKEIKTLLNIYGFGENSKMREYIQEQAKTRNKLRELIQ